MSDVLIEAVARRFDDHLALKGVSLTIKQGEFFSLLGPSGCGKTTLLNIIAGFLAPTSGRVLIAGNDVTNLPPWQRQTGMVFQNYALFPHLNVQDNISYGLKVKKVPAAARREKVAEVLKLVQMEGLELRMPHQLSGGQQQRVAIARALAIEPQVLLLDEPLSNLDARLRKDMQEELRSLQKRIGITTILVTHDQEEALTLSDRIGILGEGELQQAGSPADLYRRPANRFVAEFIGMANLMSVDEEGGELRSRDRLLSAEQPLRLRPAEHIAGSDLLMVRPERIRLRPLTEAGSGINHAPVTLTMVSYAGATLRLTGRLDGGGELIAQVEERDFSTLPQSGERWDFYWQEQDVISLPADGGAS